MYREGVSRVKYQKYDNSKASIPLYQYYGQLEYARSAIENKQIHFEKPDSYNDIFDSALKITKQRLYTAKLGTFLKKEGLQNFFSCLSEAERSKMQEEHWSIGNIIDYICQKDSTVTEDDLLDAINRVLFQGRGFAQVSNEWISCFSEIYDSLLMWAYYANNYAGVCIRFNPEKDSILQENCKKVQYTNIFKDSSGFNYCYEKSIEWSHEQEWRIVCSDMKEDEPWIETTAIDAIYLGIRMKQEEVQKFKELARKYELKLYQMVVVNGMYKIEFKEMKL